MYIFAYLPRLKIKANKSPELKGVYRFTVHTFIKILLFQ